MPIFEYSCDKCGETFELLIRSSEQRPSCPDCGSPDVHKLVSLFARSTRSGDGSSSGSGCSSCSGGSCSTCH